MTLHRIATALAAASLAGPAPAHEGHGFVGPHWHATDLLGFVLVVLLIGVALWARRK